MRWLNEWFPSVSSSLRNFRSRISKAGFFGFLAGSAFAVTITILSPVLYLIFVSVLLGWFLWTIWIFDD